MRRVVAGRRVGGHAHQFLQEAHLLVEVGVDPGVESVFAGAARVIGFCGELFEQVLEGRTHSSVSSLVMRFQRVVADAGVPPRTKSMACGITSCSFIASWPAPLGMRNTGRPRLCTARLPARCQAGALGAAAARMVSSSVPHAAALADACELGAHVGGQRVARGVGGGAQVQAEAAAAGHDVDRAVGHLQLPTVPTTSGTLPARFSTYSSSSATAAAASRRRSIGVVPAWLAMPITSPR
jgi:hypothetical protein